MKRMSEERLVKRIYAERNREHEEEVVGVMHCMMGAKYTTTYKSMTIQQAERACKIAIFGRIYGWRMSLNDEQLIGTQMDRHLTVFTSFYGVSSCGDAWRMSLMKPTGERLMWSQPLCSSGRNLCTWHVMVFYVLATPSGMKTFGLWRKIIDP